MNKTDERRAAGRQLRGAAGALAALLLGGCVVAPTAPRHTTYRAPPALPARAMYFYPERGQDEARQDRDRYECYRWAVRETGFEPGMTPTRGPSPMASVPPPNGAAVAAGTAAGAVVGAVASPGRAGEGAVIGAIFGAMLGAAAQDNRERAYEAAQAREAEAQARARWPLDDFRRAMSACMGGRGYRVE